METRKKRTRLESLLLSKCERGETKIEINSNKGWLRRRADKSDNSYSISNSPGTIGSLICTITQRGYVENENDSFEKLGNEAARIKFGTKIEISVFADEKKVFVAYQAPNWKVTSIMDGGRRTLYHGSKLPYAKDLTITDVDRLEKLTRTENEKIQDEVISKGYELVMNGWSDWSDFLYTGGFVKVGQEKEEIFICYHNLGNVNDNKRWGTKSGRWEVKLSAKRTVYFDKLPTAEEIAKILKVDYEGENE